MHRKKQENDTYILVSVQIINVKDLNPKWIFLNAFQGFFQP